MRARVLETVSRRQWLIGGGAALVLVIVLAVVFWPRPNPAPPRAREFVDYNVCLLTGSGGITADPAAAIWAGMQDAAAETTVRTQYLAVPGEQTAANAAPYLAGLVARRCNVIIATGEPAVASLYADAPKYPQVVFVAVGGTTPSPRVRQIRADGDVRAEVKATVLPLRPSPTAG
jgi:hypothetical protein